MKKYIAILFLLIVLLTLFSCAKKEGEATTEETDSENTEQTTAPEESYNPEVVDTLTEDLEELEW